MQNLMTSQTEAARAVMSGGACGYPCFILSGDEAAQVLDACERAQIKGPLLDKVKTICNYATAKNRYAGRTSIVKME